MVKKQTNNKQLAIDPVVKNLQQIAFPATMTIQLEKHFFLINSLKKTFVWKQLTRTHRAQKT